MNDNTELMNGWHVGEGKNHMYLAILKTNQEPVKIRGPGIQIVIWNSVQEAEAFLRNTQAGLDAFKIEKATAEFRELLAERKGIPVKATKFTAFISAEKNAKTDPRSAMLLHKSFEIHAVTSGNTRITTFSFFQAYKVKLLLTFRYGFSREGVYIPPIAGDGIYPDFVKGNLRIKSGVDDWFGYDFFADNNETDDFLKTFIEKHCGTREILEMAP